MQSSIHGPLARVRRRQRYLLVCAAAIWGVLAGSVAAILLFFVTGQWSILIEGQDSGFSAEHSLIWGLLLLGPALGMVVGALWPLSWRATAVTVDAHYAWKDQTTSALAFVVEPTPSSFHVLHIQDTERRLTTVEPSVVIPWRLPRLCPYALASLALALVLLLWPMAERPVEAAAQEPPEAVLAEARELEEHVKTIEAAAKDLQSEELQKLADEMRKKIAEMRQPGVNIREALAQLSSLQATLAKQQAEFNTALTDQHLQSLGSAMTSAKPLEPVGKALEEKQFEQAAKDLEKIEAPKIEPKEAKEAAERMDQAAKKMEEKGLAKLSKATQKMAEGVKGDKSKLQSGSRDLSDEIRSNERRKRINQLLAQEQQRLKDCKSRCENAARNLLARQNQSKSSQQAGKQPGGALASRNTDKVPTKAKREELRGKQGEGASEMEVENEDQEMAGKAARPDLDRYQKFQKMSEAILDNEAIPLGHRQAIRRYFELIRPSSGEGEKSKSEGAKATSE